MNNTISLFINTELVPNDFKNNIQINKAGYYLKPTDHIIYRLPDNINATDTFPVVYDDEYVSETVNESILIYCVDGEGWLMDRENKYTVESGSILYCDTNVIHAYGANPKNPWTIFWVHFTGDITKYFSSKIDSTQKCRVIKNQTRDLLTNNFNRIIELLNCYPEATKIITANSYLKSILYEITMNINTKEDLHNKEFIIRSINYMKENIDKIISLEELSSNVCLSKYHFSREFKKNIGTSPLNYFNKLKIDKACKMLKSDRQTIQEIASTLGFASPYYFSEMFKKHIGMSPKIYIRSKDGYY